MPLLGKKVFSLLKPLNSVNEGETIYTIEHTGEQFKSKKEYEQRVQLYEDKVWTCQCSGHINLTYKEACISEQDKYHILKQCFPEYFEKPVLSLVHHSTKVLDALVDDAWKMMQQSFAIGEKVQMKASTKDNVITGVIIKVEPKAQHAEILTNSPSSDKENTEANAVSPKKWTHPKLLPHLYSIELCDTNNIVNGVNANDLIRVVKPPSKDMVKLFIRGYAVRHQSSSPWVVNQDLLQKYNILNKFADFLVSPTKMIELGKKAGEKRKYTKSKHTQSAAKLKKEGKPVQVQNKKVNQSSNNQAPKKSAKQPLKSQNSTKSTSMFKKNLSKVDGESSDDDIALSVIKSAQNTPKKKTPKKDMQKKEKTPRKEKTLADVKKMMNKNDQKVKLKNAKVKLKQITLFDMKKLPKGKTSASPKKIRKSPTKSPRKATPYTQPPMVLRLVKAVQADQKHVYSQLVSRCAKELSQTQRQKLPAEVKGMVMKKYESITMKKKLARMSEEEKEEYFKKKREEHREQIKKQLKEKNKKFEDTDLPLKPLPTAKLVSTPEGLANELFGDVMMVTQFIHSYQELFCSNGHQIINTELLMNDLVSKNNCGYLCAVMVIMLQTLLQDSMVEDCRELTVPLTSIPVTPYSALEMLRLCLKKHIQDEDQSCDGNEEDALHSVSPVLIETLENTDMMDLDPNQRLNLLHGLCELLLGSYSIEDHLETKQRQMSEHWKKKIAGQKERNDMKKKLKKKNINVEEPIKQENNTGLCITDFYGKKEVEVKQEEEDIASVVKSRRLNASKAAAEKQRQDEERRIKKEQEYKEYKQQREFETIEKQFNDCQIALREAHRHVALGTDRNHSRYWLFQTCSPGLYIEKGWAPIDISYSCKPSKNIDGDDSDLEEDCCFETTLPHTGQNLWFVYDNLEVIKKVIENLHPRGFRESILKEELKKNESYITKMMKKDSKNEASDGLTDLSSDNNVIEGFREELHEVELRLRNGGLGGVKDYESWEKKLNDSDNIQQFTELLMEVQSSVLPKFIKGLMAPKLVCKDSEEVKDEDMNTGLDSWLQAVKSCSTFSRLHLLLGIMDSGITWEKSAENAKCKICRKKGDEDRLILCDECNNAFHFYCLRPQIFALPEGDWFCVACAPPTKRRRTVHNYKELESPKDSCGEEDENDEEEMEESDAESEIGPCIVCDGDEDTFCCGTCGDSFHLDCHEPPLRYAPRNNQWRCQQCKSGVRIKHTSKGKRKKTSDTEEESDEEEEDEEETDVETEEEETETEETDEEESAEPPAKRRCVIYLEPEVRKSNRPRVTNPKYMEVDEEGSPTRDALKDLQRRSAGSSTRKSKAAESQLLESVIDRLSKHRHGWPFVDPVDANEVPDYYEIIQNPIDFRDMMRKAKQGEYKEAQDLVDDVALLFDNAERYNEEDSIVGKCIKPLEATFRQILKSQFSDCKYHRDPQTQTIYDDHAYITNIIYSPPSR